MIHNREVMLKTIIDKVQHKPVLDFTYEHLKKNR